MVRTNIKGLNVEITEALGAHIKGQVKKLTDNFEDIVVEDIVVTVAVDSRHNHIQKATIKIPVKGDDVVVEDKGEDLYKVITSTVQKGIRSVRKVKEKNLSKNKINKKDLLKED